MKAKETQARFYNKGCRVDTSYQPGDHVWLSRRHIKTRRPNSKLDVRRLGPFVVEQMIGKNAAELALPPAYSRLHPVFNISLLMPYLGPVDTTPDLAPFSQLGTMDQFVDWAAFSYVLDYRMLAPDVHEYLIRGHDSSSLNDKWKLLTMLSPHLDIFLQCFHLATPSRGSGPQLTVWQQHSRMLV